MFIVGYKKFLESRMWDFGCVLVNYDLKNWSQIIHSISEEDLYNQHDENSALEKNPHLTLLYGLHTTVSVKDVEDCFRGFSLTDFRVRITGVSVFENKDYDVLKFDIEKNSKLDKINSNLKELPNSSEYPEYRPHITICYLKPGNGRKYINLDYNYHISSVKNIIYSLASGKEYIIKL